MSSESLSSFYLQRGSDTTSAVDNRPQADFPKTRFLYLTGRRSGMSIKTQKAALAEATRRWGKNAAVRLDKRALVGEERAAATERMREHNAQKPTPQYVEGKTTPEYREWRKRGDELLGQHYNHRCTIGAVMFGMFFEVKGQGDTWDAAFAAVDEAEARDRERYAKLRASR